MVQFQDQLATQLRIVDSNGNTVIQIGPGPDLQVLGTNGSIDMDATGKGTGQPTIYFNNNLKNNFAFVNLGRTISPNADLGITNGVYNSFQYPGNNVRARLFFGPPGQSSQLGGSLDITQGDIGGQYKFSDHDAIMAVANASGVQFTRIFMSTLSAPGVADQADITMQAGDGTGLNGPLFRLTHLGTRQVILMQNAANTRVIYQDTDGYWKIVNEDWTNFSYQNGWTGSGQYKLLPDGTVRFRGRITPGTRTDGTIVANLPTLYRPVISNEFITSWVGGGFWGKLAVTNTADHNGDVLFFNGSGNGSDTDIAQISYSVI